MKGLSTGEKFSLFCKIHNRGYIAILHNSYKTYKFKTLLKRLSDTESFFIDTKRNLFYHGISPDHPFIKYHKKEQIHSLKELKKTPGKYRYYNLKEQTYFWYDY